MKRGGWLRSLVGLLAVAGVLSAGSGATAATRGDWVENGFDAANSHFNPSERILTRSNVGGLTASWSLDNDAESPPAVAGERVYVQTLSAVNAYDRATGDLLWSHPVASSTFQGSLAVADDTVYALSAHIGSTAPVLYALATADGSQRWKRKVPTADNRPLVVSDGSVYVPAAGGVVVVDAATHKAKPLAAEPGYCHRPSIAGGRVFVACDGGDLFAFDAATRRLDWRITVNAHRLIGAPVAMNGLVYEQAGAGVLLAIDETDGSTHWSLSTGTKFTGDVAAAKGTVYVGDYAGDFEARNATTGKQRWKVSLGAQATDEATVADGVVYLTTQDKLLRALDATTGAPLFTQSAGAVSESNVVVSDGNVFLTGATGHLRRWTLPD